MKVVSVKGFNIDKFLHNLQECAITPKKIKRINHSELLIEISNKDYKKLLVKKIVACYNISVIDSGSNDNKLLSLVKRVGLIIGLTVAAFIMVIGANSITAVKISVSGNNEEQLRHQAQIVLHEHNIIAGGKLEKSFKEIEDLILSELETSASVMVKKNGNELVISIKEITMKPEPEHNNIVAFFDGKITQINHTSGTLKVNVGEGVVKGQVLIESGYVGDFFAEANGDVFADVIISGTAVGAVKQTSVKRTGRFTTICELELLNKTFALDGKRVDEIYTDYEVEREENFLCEYMFIPIKLVKYNIYELETVEIDVEESIVIEELKNNAFSIAENNLPDDANIENITFNILNDNGFIKVICNIETEILIGKRQ